jgi:GGDEF domain-containing protein
MKNQTFEDLDREVRSLRRQLIEARREIEILRSKNGIPEDLYEKGLVDEYFFFRRFREAIRSSQRYARFFCVVRVDVDEGLARSEAYSSGPGLNVETACHLKRALRQTDVVALMDSGQILILFEELETSQAILALRRIQEDMMDIPSPKYSVVCFPSDGNQEEHLLDLLNQRIVKVSQSAHKGGALGLGEEVLSLMN